MNDLDLHTWTVSTSVGTVFSGPVLVEPQTLGVHVPPTVQSVLVAAPVYNCNVNIIVTCSAFPLVLRKTSIFDNLCDATKISKMIFDRVSTPKQKCVTALAFLHFFKTVKYK